MRRDLVWLRRALQNLQRSDGLPPDFSAKLRELSQNIEFTMKRLRDPIDGLG